MTDTLSIYGDKRDFPLLMAQDIAYLDSSATAQKPQCVIDAEKQYYEVYNANPLRGFYDLAMEATDQYEIAREKVARFLNAKKTEEIIFTRNTTESLNLIAYSYALNNLTADDEILITISEHHSNMLPWRMVAEKTGARLVYLMCNEEGIYTEQAVREAITPRTKLAAIGHISNVLGSINPIELITELVHANDGVMVIDGAQSAPHIAVDVQKLDCDFFAFSGHKLMAPMGIGVLYGKMKHLKKMPPFMTGGEMIDSVTLEKAVWAPVPHKFEAGTVNGGGAAGLAAAIDYINAIGFETIEARERELTRLCFKKMNEIKGVHILGSPRAEDHNGILSFVVDGVHPHDISAILNEDNICVRAGHHCAQPLLAHLGVKSSVRASLMFYNTEEDINRFIASLSSVRGQMGIGN